MKLAIIGSRDFNDYPLLVDSINSLVEESITMIVSGGAKGADSLGEKYANENNIPIKIFKPDWKKHGRAAGFIRNVDIVKESDTVIAFWDGKSRGTENSINHARKMDKGLLIVHYNEEQSNVF